MTKPEASVQAEVSRLFLAEATLGRLAKWLRLLGFDARYHAGGGFEEAAESCETQRIVLTRTKKTALRFTDRSVIFIDENDPEEQLRAVISQLKIAAEDLKPFSRCLRCNRETDRIPREAAKGRVPDYVFQTAARFTRCAQCGRIYWPGTHTERALERIRALLKPAASEPK